MSFIFDVVLVSRVATALCVVLPLICHDAAAEDDPIRKLQLDRRAATAFAETIAKSVMVVDGFIAPPEWADPRTPGPRVAGLAVAVRCSSKRVALVTSGVFGGGIRNASIRGKNGTTISVLEIRAIGDGGLSELVIPDSVLNGLQFLDVAADVELKRGVPVLSVIGAETKQPALFYGVILEQLPAPLAHIYSSDIKFPHGAPLVGADGRLMAITYRTQPTDEDIGWAIGAGSIDEWLRPEGPPEDTGKATVPAR